MYPDPKCITKEGKELKETKVKRCLRSARQKDAISTVEEERWQGKLLRLRWEDENLNQENCFSWLHLWKTAPTHVVVGIQELYQQLLPTKVLYNRKTGTGTTRDEKCRMCRKATESVSHILAGCGALAQTKYLSRHNNALKILFFDMIRSLDLISAVGPWYSKAQPKPMYENERAMAYWDIPL